MLHSERAPLWIVCLARSPQPDLQIHHRIDDGVVAVDGPRSHQFRRRIVEFFQARRRAQSTITILDILRLTITEDRRVIIEETGVMILGHLFSKETCVPKLGPTTKTFIFGFAVKLPKCSDPEAPGPKKAFLRFPFAGLIVAFREEAFARVARGCLGRRL